MYAFIKNESLDFDLVMDVTLHTSFTEPQKYGRAMKGVNANPLDFYTVSPKVRDYALSKLPGQIFSLEVPEVILLIAEAKNCESPAITAHIDHKRNCALNVYLETNGETTHYYNWDPKTKTLTDVGMFKAQTGEWWLLDTSKLHGVMLVPGKRREMLSFSFTKADYADVQKILMGCM